MDVFLQRHLQVKSILNVNTKCFAMTNCVIRDIREHMKGLNMMTVDKARHLA